MWIVARERRGKRPKLFQQLFARYGRGEQCSSHGQNSQRRGKERGGKREREREREREGKKEEDHKQSGTCGRVMVRPRAIKPLSDRGTGTSGRLGRGGSPQWCSTGCDSSIHLINPWGYNQEIPANVVGTRPLGVCTGSWVLDCRINIDNGCLILLFFFYFSFFSPFSLSHSLSVCVSYSWCLRMPQ